MKKTYMGVAVSVVTFLSACSFQDPEQPPQVIEEPTCTAELSPVVTPKVVNLPPEETAQPIFEVFTCSGEVELQVKPRWVSADPNVATVDESSGLITAQPLGGNTEVTGSEEEYGTSAVVRVNVAVY